MPTNPLHCQRCGRTYAPAGALRGASLSCAACGGPLGEQPPPETPAEPKDSFRGRRVAGALLKKRLAVLPTRAVYHARHEKLRRDVRVEVFTASFAEANLDYARRLFDGAAHTQDLHSLHVATVFDLGRLPDCCYIISESFPDDLRGVLDKKVHLPLRRALHTAEEVLEGLQAIEADGATHGNVTPDGILLGYDGAARLDHLGAALRPEDAARLTVTPRGMLAGPALYRAPEGSQSIRSDLYSLGCALYQTLAGRPPIVGLSTEDIRQKHAAGHVPGLRVERPELPEAVARYVARLMAVRPEDRPATAAQALAELRELADELARSGAIRPIRAATGARRKLFDVTWTSAWSVVAVLLLAATIAPFVIMARLHRARIRTEQAAAVRDPNAVAVLMRPQDPRAPDPLSADQALAVRTLLLYRLSFYPGLSPADPDLTAAFERTGGTPQQARSTLGVDRFLVAAHAGGFARHHWTLAFSSYRQEPWTESADASVEQATPDMAPLEEAARRVLRAAAARLGPEVPNPPDDAVVGASAQGWAEVGRALQAEAGGRWAEAAEHAHAAGPQFGALADYYDAVRGAEQTGRFPPPGPPPQTPTPPELAGLDAILHTISTGQPDEVTARFGAFLVQHPRSARGYFLLGLWRLKAAGQPDEAALALRHAAKLDPSYQAAASALTEPNTR